MKIIQRYPLIFVCVFFFLVYLMRLTALPIFNDEAIYLDWGWSYTHMSGHVFDSLLDAKQPLMIWIFGIVENIFQDPLFAGRFTAVLISMGSIVGIYQISKKLVDKNVSIIAAITYAIIPIFVFYNRQALLEAAISCVGIWSCYAVINIVERPVIKNGIMLGVILGIGFFIKSSSLLFIIPSIFIIIYFLFKKRSVEMITSSIITIVTFIFVDILLFVNPLFWQSFSSNSRYVFTLHEFFLFPAYIWFHSILGFFEIGFVFMTPFVFLSSLVGVGMLWRHRKQNMSLFLMFFITSLIIELFSNKSQSQRYLVPFLPFLVIPASYIFSLLWKKGIWAKTVVVLAYILPLTLTGMVIFNPVQYISQIAKVSQYADTFYTQGQTSGFGINEAMHYIYSHSSTGQPAMVLFGLNTGNPESAIDVYTNKTSNLYALHTDARLFQGLMQFTCFSSTYPLFLVTRDDQTVGLGNYFMLAKSFANPDKKYSVRIYTLKKDCKGKTLSLSDVYQPSMNKIDEIKQGLYN